MTTVSLLDTFPRAMGHPRQDFVAYDSFQRDSYIDRYIMISDLYISVYSFTEINEKGYPVRETAVIDKVFFDFDSKNWLKDLIKFHIWCKKHDYLHRCHCSGRGGHGFIFTKRNVNNKKQAIGNFQRYLAKELNLDLDKKIIGDIARIFRYPNTYNFKAERWCVPLPPALLERPNIKERNVFIFASRQQFVNAWSGSRLLDLSKWDTMEYQYMDFEASDVDLNDIKEDVKVEYSLFPPCVQSWLSTPEMRDDLKYLVILFLKDQFYTEVPYSIEEIVGIMKKSLSDDEFNHYFRNKRLRRHAGHNGKKFRTLMRSDYYMPNCDELIQRGFCKKECGRRNPIYD